MILICSTPTTPTVGFMACVRACLEMCVCVCVRFALVCCALRVDFIKSLRLTNTVIIIIIIRMKEELSLPSKHLQCKLFMLHGSSSSGLQFVWHGVV